ncbi:hypothetical protein KDH_50660 [Dictyobacter sp. S3.2.2.5]|uniref:phosphoribosylglycinamide formyltransferase 1 n=1 Tax=Dictyobacter halimunensis TaxID=3026934 RepID=A0ABQ6G0P5_9CHLR|nr:hypothetical protein KDH_50660 [Dictyobacter sp. S3.2.2.5]
MSGIEHSSQPSESKSVAPLRVAVLISGSGSNLQALIDAVEGRQLPGVEIVLVISNKASAQGLQRALKHKLPAAYIPWKKREEAEQQMLSLLQLFRADLIVLAGLDAHPECRIHFPISTAHDKPASRPATRR